MGLNDTPSANRVHIGFFGRRNVGKSSVVNAVTGQDVAVVSDVRGTTTDPVYKAMELLPLGPVMIIDTPGVDDEGALGELRVRKTKQVLNKSDVAVLVIDATVGKTEADAELAAIFREKNIPYVIVYNKCDLLTDVPDENVRDKKNAEEIFISATTKYHVQELKERIASLAAAEETKLKLVGDLIEPSDFVVLVTPIDKAAPKGRLILPQQQTIRDVLEADAVAVVVKEFELREALENLGKKPKLVITDSQVFAKVSADVPKDVLLTSFSILFARYKGSLLTAVRGAKAIETLTERDTVLISEGCTHHRQCDDIGSVKLPRWIRNYAGKQIQFAFTSGVEFPEDLSPYKLIVHCGGCMLNEREMKYRVKSALDQNVPITNYGVLIAYMQGILKRSLSVFPNVLADMEE
ncbi:MAG: [FeFe] hydrogenase H-cluster maturation GTPase HydF [Planctomycetaceae bacterium]|nr:[FeFe] hydrogenase H-cluster maturation GTPase HydF [Planctomycetaceae bacterium]